MLPAPGTFLRPIGGPFTWCYQVIDVLQPSREWPRGHLTMKRWGMDDAGQPVNDGNLRDAYLDGIHEVLPGVFKDPWEHDTPRWMCCPLYYRRIDVSGQRELF